MKILYVEDEIAHVFVLTQRTLEENLQQEFRLIHTRNIAGRAKDARHPNQILILS
jgi:hypothetical protein